MCIGLAEARSFRNHRSCGNHSTTPTMLGTTPTMLGTAPTMRGTSPTMPGTAPMPPLPPTCTRTTPRSCPRTDPLGWPRPRPAKRTPDVGRCATRVWAHRLPKGPLTPNEVLPTRPATALGERRKRGPLPSALFRQEDARPDDCRPGGEHHACPREHALAFAGSGKSGVSETVHARAPLTSGVAGEGEARQRPAPPTAASRLAARALCAPRNARALCARRNGYLPGAAKEPPNPTYDLCAVLYTGRVGPWGKAPTGSPTIHDPACPPARTWSAY